MGPISLTAGAGGTGTVHVCVFMEIGAGVFNTKGALSEVAGDRTNESATTVTSTSIVGLACRWRSGVHNSGRGLGRR